MTRCVDEVRREGERFIEWSGEKSLAHVIVYAFVCTCVCGKIEMMKSLVDFYWRERCECEGNQIKKAPRQRLTTVMNGLNKLA